QGTLLTSSKEESGDLSSNSSDSGSESFNRDVALSMVASEQEALHEVEAAIDRVFDGSFGICQETGKPIKRDRLKAVPFTRFSLEGQALHEQSDGRLVERGGIFTNLSEDVPGMPTDDDS
ncbi:MAG: TraR/DksA C4-type zinc finger protein, partial [Opitutales bacterium]